jgi:hypothetical protein
LFEECVTVDREDPTHFTNWVVLQPQIHLKSMFDLSDIPKEWERELLRSCRWCDSGAGRPTHEDRKKQSDTTDMAASTRTTAQPNSTHLGALGSCVTKLAGLIHA